MNKSVFTAILTLSFLVISANANAFTLCNDPLRNQEICNKMRNLRSQVNLLEAQRDLVRVDYQFLKTLSADMDDLVSEIAKDSTITNLAGIESLQARITTLKKLAESDSPRALVAANQVHGECMSCHSSQNPRSGYSWEIVAERTWGRIGLNCNQEAAVIRPNPNTGAKEVYIEPAPRTGAPLRNPYRCKHMHAMFGTFEYFFTASNANRLNFEMTEVAAKELARIAGDLKARNMVHRGANGLLGQVEKNAKELQVLASQKNSLAKFKRLEIMNACTKCHNQDRRLPFSEALGINGNFR